VSELRRYARQMRLAEIGEQGQRRLSEAMAKVAGRGLKHEIATDYARRAGMGGIVSGELDESYLAPSFLEHGAPRAVVAGSRAALAALRAALFPEDQANRTP
jgi:hypothetical protein